MKAFVIDRYGKQEIGRIAEVAEPALRDDDVLVAIHAASVNVLDLKIRRGEFKLLLPYSLPLALGHDLAGIVVKVGARVARFKPGDAVYARPDDGRIGTFAEMIAVRETSLAHKPAALTMEEAASMPLVALTAWQALVETAKLQKGQKVFIQAGSGGVGVMAIQLANYLGAFVATTTSTANMGWVKSLGADLVIDYTQQDATDVLRDYDLVLNSLGTDALRKSLGVLKQGGRLVSISGPPTPAFARERGLSWPLQQVMRGLSFSVRARARKLGVTYEFLLMHADGSQLESIAALVASGAVKPVIDRVFPLDKTADALAYVATGRARGKVVIQIKEG
jgi:NADPH:quinone reductase-like Zn-dependent oxidoreductase